MIPALDFAVLPPEVSSGRMYSGAGPGPLLAAAAAWNALAAELRCTAQGYSSTLAELNCRWHGPSSTAMMAAVVPYMAWLNATAGQAEHTAAMAEAAVAAYEAAFAATVPPAVVAANRARLMVLVATNVLGQNTPAIAATEGEYAEMWAQDASAMYGYAAASSVAIELTPFGPPGQTTNPGGLAGQSAAVVQAVGTPAGARQAALSQTISAMPNALAGWNPFAPGSASDTTGINGVLNAIFGTNTTFGQLINANIWNSIFMSAFYMPAKYLGNTTSLMSLGQPNGPPRRPVRGRARPVRLPNHRVVLRHKRIRSRRAWAEARPSARCRYHRAGPRTRRRPAHRFRRRRPHRPRCRRHNWAARPRCPWRARWAVTATTARYRSTASNPPSWRAHPPPVRSFGCRGAGPDAAARR